jgi:hypothetical protein
MTKPSELSRRRASHVILFGDPKTGKSTLAAELLLKGYNLTWISLDNGHEVIFKLPLTAEQLDTHLNIIIVPDTKDAPVALKTCLDLSSGKVVSICDTHGQSGCSTCTRAGNKQWSKVDTNNFGPMDILVYDHIGQLANSAIHYAMKNSKDEDKPEWEHYRVQGTLMDKFLTNTQQAPYNVICIAHTAETEMEDGSKRLVPLVGTVPFSRNVGKYFDHMVHCQVLNRNHKFGSSTGYANRIVTGSRSDVVIENEKVPSLEKFFNGSQQINDHREDQEAAATVINRLIKPTSIPATELLAKLKGASQK